MNLKKIFSICILLICGSCVVYAQEPKADLEKQSLEEYLNKDFASNVTKDGVSAEKTNRRVSVSTFVQMIVVLFFILFLILLFFYMTKGKLKKAFVGNNGIEVICRASLAPKQSLMVVRVGTRLLILNASSDGHVSTLSELTDRNEIAEFLSEVNKASRDNLFDSLLKRNQVLYDEEMKNVDKSLEKVDRATDQLQENLEKEKRV